MSFYRIPKARNVPNEILCLNKRIKTLGILNRDLKMKSKPITIKMLENDTKKEVNINYFIETVLEQQQN